MFFTKNEIDIVYEKHILAFSRPIFCKSLKARKDCWRCWRGRLYLIYDDDSAVQFNKVKKTLFYKWHLFTEAEWLNFFFFWFIWYMSFVSYSTGLSFVLYCTVDTGTAVTSTDMVVVLKSPSYPVKLSRTLEFP